VASLTAALGGRSLAQPQLGEGGRNPPKQPRENQRIPLSTYSDGLLRRRVKKTPKRIEKINAGY